MPLMKLAKRMYEREMGREMLSNVSEHDKMSLNEATSFEKIT